MVTTNQGLKLHIPFPVKTIFLSILGLSNRFIFYLLIILSREKRHYSSAVCSTIGFNNLTIDSDIEDSRPTPLLIERAED